MARFTRRRTQVGSVTKEAADDVRAAAINAKLKLGERLSSRREELGLTKTEVGAKLGLTPQYYGEIESGTKQFAAIETWIRLADVLQLNRVSLIEHVWDVRRRFEIHLPSKGHRQRQRLLELVVELYSESEPEPI